MITRRDVQLTLEALDPTTPASDVDALFNRIQDEKDQYREAAYMRMKTRHQQVRGTNPDGRRTWRYATKRRWRPRTRCGDCTWNR